MTILEVGAGTGPVTRELARLLNPNDRFDTVEANPRFAEVLAQSLRTDPVFTPVNQQIHLFSRPIAQVPLTRQYDAIVSCLPFANFPPAEVRSILDTYLAALKPDGHLMYIGYLGSNLARSIFSGSVETARHRAVMAVLADFHERHQATSTTVWRNMPPARVWHLRAGGETGSTASSCLDVSHGASR